jgi:cyclic-di-GMP phosphodiesterase, flagellum assembly factor TipF
MATKLNTAPGQLVFLDALVLVAMAITAAAFAVGLIVNSGVDTIPGVIAGAALFMVMASAHFAVTRSARSGVVSGRIDQLEEALLILDADLQRIDQVEDDVARLDLLNDRVERLDQAVSGQEQSDGSEAWAHVDRLSTDFENLHARLDALRADLEGEARSERDKISTELRQLEGLIKQLSRELTVAASAASSSANSEEAYLAQVEAPSVAGEADETGIEEDEADDVQDSVVDTLILTEAELVVHDADTDTTAPDDNLLEIVREAVARTRIDLYLQPIVALPERESRYFEVLTRLRSEADELILPEEFMPVAESAGLMPSIDNVMLVKSVQLLRRLGPDSKVKGVFCNISIQSLLDPDFFPELVEFMEENSALSDSLFFEFRHHALVGLSPDELENLKVLGRLGFRFSLGHVADLDIDFAALRDNHFRFVKIAANTLFDGLDEAGISARHLNGDLKNFDLELIVEKVEEEANLDQLKDLDVSLAQGFALAQPKPYGPEFFRELEDADAVQSEIAS